MLRTYRRASRTLTKAGYHCEFMAALQATTDCKSSSKSTPEDSKIDPERRQNRAKIAQGGSVSGPERPKSAQERPKSAPRAAQKRSKSAPRAPQERPRAPQEPPKSAQRRPREPSGHHFEARMFEKSAFRERAVARLGQEAPLERFSVDFRSMRANAEP